MSFNLASILEKILQEEVSPDKVNDAINNKYQVIITYRDENSNAIGKRLIEPYAYGASKRGNPVFRAYQYEGDTLRGKPKWKLFRLDRVETWEPTGNHFNQQPRDRKWNAEEYNNNGDKSMSVVYNQVYFDSFDDKEDDGIFRTDFEKEMIKRKKQRQQSTPVKVQDLVPTATDIINTDNKPGVLPKISDKEWERKSKSAEDIRNKNINKRRDKRAFDRTDKQPTWRKSSDALNQYIDDNYE